MKNQNTASPSLNLVLGYVFGLLGVIAFSLTPIATKLALESFTWQQTLILRWDIACLLAWGYVFIHRKKIHFPLTHLKAIVVLSITIVFGFPFVISAALTEVSASHVGVFIAGIPLASALFTAILGHESPRLGFWVLGTLGAIVVIVYSLMSGDEFGNFHAFDIWLFIAINAVGIGYATSGKLSYSLGGLEIMVWALVMFSPIAVLLTLLNYQQFIFTGTSSSWVGLFYIGSFSQLFGFFAWNRGLKWGGTSKISQLALLQSFLTLAFSALILDEIITPLMITASTLTVLFVLLSSRMRVDKK